MPKFVSNGVIRVCMVKTRTSGPDLQILQFNFLVKERERQRERVLRSVVYYILEGRFFTPKKH